MHGAVDNLLIRQAQMTRLAAIVADPVEAFTSLLADPHRRSANRQAELVQTPEICLGWITGAFPYINCYRVELYPCGSDLICCRSSGAGLTSLGPSEINTLPINQSVLVARLPRLPYGFILGAVPDITGDNIQSYPDFIFQGSRTGFDREQFSRDVRRLCVRNAGLLDFSAGRPYDGITGQEWGAITPTGLAIVLDDFQAFIRVNEAAGLFLNYLDGHVRLAGQQLDIQGPGHELVARQDEGETLVIYGETPFPWEAEGLLDRNAPLATAQDPKRAVDDGDVAAYEPVNAKALGFYRYRELGGYLGQGRQRLVAVPPPTKPSWTLDDEGTELGVFREQVAGDGTYFLASAAGVVLAKTFPFPVPKQKQQPESSEGDDRRAGNYRFAGLSPSGGDEHKLGKLDLKTEDGGAAAAAGAADDYTEFHRNWRANAAAHYHKKDWEVRQAGDTLYQPASWTTSVLVSQFAIAQPTPVKIKVDPVRGDVDYFINGSRLALLPDGGISLTDAYGAELRTGGGNIFLDAPGDIYFRSGRGTHLMAGDDCTIRAKHSIDVTSTKKDVRVKGHVNTHIVAGVSGTGTLLLESKSVGSAQDLRDKFGEDVKGAGLVIKAAKSPLVQVARQLYLRTGGGDVERGDIVIDASKSEEDVIVLGRTMTRYLANSAIDAFGAPGSAETVMAWSASGSAIGSSLAVGRNMLVDGQLVCRGGLSVLDGGIGVSNGSPFVGDLKKSEGTVRAAYSLVRNQTQETIKNVNNLWRTVVDGGLYKEQRVGNDDVIRFSSFSFRTEEQYGAGSDLVVPEARWQQLDRVAGKSGPVWKEEPVTVGGKATYPFPGNRFYTSDNSLLQVDPQLFDPAKMAAKDRPEPYAKDLVVKTNRVSLNSYRVIRD